jgi:hypothetical protein
MARLRGPAHGRERVLDSRGRGPGCHGRGLEGLKVRSLCASRENLPLPRVWPTSEI